MEVGEVDMRASRLLDAVRGNAYRDTGDAGDGRRGDRTGARREGRPCSGQDGSYAEVARERTHDRQVCDAVSQDLRRATSFSNRRQQDRRTPYEGALRLSTH